MNLVTNTQEQNMIFTNTASVVYEIEADDFYKNSSLFDQKIQNFLIQSIKKIKDEVKWSHETLKSLD